MGLWHRHSILGAGAAMTAAAIAGLISPSMALGMIIPSGPTITRRTGGKDYRILAGRAAVAPALSMAAVAAAFVPRAVMSVPAESSRRSWAVI
jgi:hypothetical protein